MKRIFMSALLIKPRDFRLTRHFFPEERLPWLHLTEN
jgi:hypothetical protein